MSEAKENLTTTRRAYVQANKLIGPKHVLTLKAFRDLVAATSDYDELSRVELESTSISVTETKQTGWTR